MSASEQPAALIVGGGTGIGYTSAIRPARRGVALVLPGQREHVLAGAAERLRQAVDGARLTLAPGDASTPDGAERMVDVVVEAIGAIDVCVNAAGMYEPVGFTDLGDEPWRRTMRSNLNTQFFVALAATPRMAGRKDGRMIQISSVSDPLSEAASRAVQHRKGRRQLAGQIDCPT